MPKSGVWLSHAAVGCISAALAALVTCSILGGPTAGLHVVAAQAQTSDSKTTDLMTTKLSDLGREMRIRLFERGPGNASPPHRHPGHHTFGYILEGTYELKIDDGPVRQLKAGEVFYEPPGALHAISRNPSSDHVLKYLVIQVADPSKPGTVREDQ